jgi:hypothetical protein
MDNGVSVNLVNAVKVAMKVKSLSSAPRSYMFVFADGLFGESTKAELKNPFRMCREGMIEVFGIGIGEYPAGAFSPFSNVVWAPHPRLLRTKSETMGFHHQRKLICSHLNSHYDPRLAHNLASLFEGDTIAKVKDLSKLGPFISFSYDSQGGFPLSSTCPTLSRCDVISSLTVGSRNFSWNCQPTELSDTVRISQLLGDNTRNPFAGQRRRMDQGPSDQPH